MRRALVSIFIFLGVVILVTGCGKFSAKHKEADALATVNGKIITVEEFDRKLSSLPNYYQNVARQRKKEFLEDMINETLLYNEALKAGLDHDEEVMDMIKTAERRILISKLIKGEVENVTDITDQEIGDYYNSNMDKFRLPERWRVSHILLKTEEEAKAVLVELANGTSFEALAKEKSLDPSSAKGGDIGFFTTGQLVPEFEEAATSLNVGEVSGIVKTQFGFHIIKLTDHRLQEVQDLEIIKPRIKNELIAQKKKEVFEVFLQDLRSKSKIEIDDTLLEPAEEPSAPEEITEE